VSGVDVIRDIFWVALRMPDEYILAMKATTIKLEGKFLEEIRAAKPEGESLTGYVRTVLRRDIEQRKMEEAALAYRAFVESEAGEKQWLEEWEQADMASHPSMEDEL